MACILGSRSSTSGSDGSLRGCVGPAWLLLVRFIFIDFVVVRFRKKWASHDLVRSLSLYVTILFWHESFMLYLL